MHVSTRFVLIVLAIICFIIDGLRGSLSAKLGFFSFGWALLAATLLIAS
jgi:hypothetical protein